MAKTNFASALAGVLVHEGGFVNHPADPGGATNKGITLANFRRYVKRGGTVADLKSITDAQVAQVYRKHYWDRVKGDDLPSGIDYAVFDFGVNSGPDRAVKYLQAVLGVKQDGTIGPVTLAAARAANAANVVDRLCDDRMAFLKRLKHWPTFGKGWTRRVDDVRAKSLAMATARPAQPANPKPTPTPPISEEKPPKGIAGVVALIIAAIGAAITKFIGIW
ncbi:glycoside hydrolase family 108 protein [Pelagibacterium flavum]|uniref:Glycoside hydrolase family 108 protein n=1 Tax=Pelagibacterium flavum TaxID=2984530 RepID=A0ABY6IK20_9HYPH|nr:glycoside hydrolase family 108 protein [Pelagibacterium sp. YIM 151497]UYQ70956.1 glycoside hydrolase family 108 protein [Pelagibacterium sp. YIM 151497]